MILGPKSLDCLRLAALHANYAGGTWDPWQTHYEAICKRYSAKAVHRKMEELTRRGYIIIGPDPKLGAAPSLKQGDKLNLCSSEVYSLTEKGREVLESATPLCG
jgi:hypothetical protein